MYGSWKGSITALTYHIPNCGLNSIIVTFTFDFEIWVVTDVRGPPTPLPADTFFRLSPNAFVNWCNVVRATWHLCLKTRSPPSRRLIRKLCISGRADEQTNENQPIPKVRNAIAFRLKTDESADLTTGWLGWFKCSYLGNQTRRNSNMSHNMFRLNCNRCCPISLNTNRPDRQTHNL